MAARRRSRGIPPGGPRGIPRRWPGKLEKGLLRQVKPSGPTLRFRYNPATVQPGGGTGGWSRVHRPQRRVALEWAGIPERTLAFTLLLDGYEADRSVEPECRMLERMGEPRAPQRPPPVLEFVYGPAGRGRRWVIDGLAWGAELRNSNLQRVRQEVTVTLVEYEDVDVVLTAADRHRKRRGRKRKDEDDKDEPRQSRRTYTVKRGDTLSSIAAKKLGAASRWREIARLNKIRDPRKLRVGQRLHLPEG